MKKKAKKGKKKDSEEKEKIEEISSGIHSSGKKTLSKDEKESLKKQSDKNYDFMKKQSNNKKTQVMKEEEKDKKRGDNPEGVTELIAAINKLSEKESDRIYTMLRKKHEKKKINEQEKHSPKENVLKATSNLRYTAKDENLEQAVQELVALIIATGKSSLQPQIIETIIQKFIVILANSSKTITQTKVDLSKIQKK